MSERTRKNEIKLNKLKTLKKGFWLHEVIAPGFFVVCIGGLTAALLNAAVSPEQTTKKVAAKEAVHLVTLSRTPFFRADGKKFAVLGLGQDARSGRQLVWIKSVATNKIKGYREGDALFGSAVTIARISDSKIDINNLGVKIPVMLPQ